MLNKNQKKRLVLLLILPLTLLGLWLAESGYKLFFPSNYFGYCTPTLGCNGYESHKDQIFEVIEGGIYLGGTATGARLESGLNSRITLANSGEVKSLMVPFKVKVEGQGCSLEHHQQYDRSKYVDGAMKVVSSVNDVFTLDCGVYSQPEFRFADIELHEALVSALREHGKLQKEFGIRQTRLAIAAFFAPFFIFFGAWALISVFMSLVRFVRFGRFAA